ncbi:MAG: serine hydrolase domain-containing protein [Thermoanaerobaculia bacterium]
MSRRPAAPLALALTLSALAAAGPAATAQPGPPGPPGPPFPAPALSSGMGDAELAGALGAYFGALHDERDFAGAALVARGGTPVFLGAWGMASLRWGVPNRVSTRFDLGSIDKSFTRVAIGSLLAAGELSLDSTIAQVLPDYPNQGVAGRVTVGQLLDHTSGIPDIFGPDFFDTSKLLYREARDFFPLFASKELEFEPGTEERYSNSGYLVLGAMIEQLSGTSYPEWVARHVFEPAGMTGAGFFARNEPEPDVAMGHTHWGPAGPEPDGPWLENLGLLPVRGNAAGSAFATVRDVLAYERALRSGRLLPPGYTSWFFGGPVDPSADAGQARGAAIGIAGGAPGVNACLEASSDWQVVVLSNQDPPGAELAAQAVFRALAGAAAG